MRKKVLINIIPIQQKNSKKILVLQNDTTNSPINYITENKSDVDTSVIIPIDTFITTDTLLSNNENTDTISQNYIKPFKFNLYSNILYDLAFTPNIGIEIIYKEKFSLLLNGLWMHLNWKDGARCYRIWSTMPEIRYYFPKNQKFYAGAMFCIGQINLKFNSIGNQGDFVGGGLIFGYIANITKKLKMDFGLGLGYINYKYNTYDYVDGVNFRRDSVTKNLFIPTKAGISLVWNII